MSAAEETITTHYSHAIRFIGRDEALDIVANARTHCSLHLLAESALVKIYGDTMSPEYEDGDTLLINAAWQAIWQPGVYVLRTDKGYIAQRGMHVPCSNPSMVVLCHDVRIKPMETVPASSLDVVGFVVCRSDAEMLI